MTSPQSTTGRDSGALAQSGAPDAGFDLYTFRAPRSGDLVVCPYCDADTFTCDHCGGERRLYASEVLQ